MGERERERDLCPRRLVEGELLPPPDPSLLSSSKGLHCERNSLSEVATSSILVDQDASADQLQILPHDLSLLGSETIYPTSAFSVWHLGAVQPVDPTHCVGQWVPGWWPTNLRSSLPWVQGSGRKLDQALLLRYKVVGGVSWELAGIGIGYSNKGEPLCPGADISGCQTWQQQQGGGGLLPFCSGAFRRRPPSWPLLEMGS